jgi:hypothetical protein
MPSSWRTAGRSIWFFGISAFTQNSGTRIIRQQSHEFAALEARHDERCHAGDGGAEQQLAVIGAQFCLDVNIDQTAAELESPARARIGAQRLVDHPGIGGWQRADGEIETLFDRIDRTTGANLLGTTNVDTQDAMWRLPRRSTNRPRFRERC